MAVSTGGITVTLNTRRLEALMRGLQPKAEAILDKTAFDIEAGAKKRAPVDTGALRNSIHVEKDKPLERIIADGVEYGVFNEFGINQRLQPFMTPAVEAVRKGFAKAWEALFR